MKIFHLLFIRALQWFVVGPSSYGTGLSDAAGMRKKRIALTFDDGPREEALGGILDALHTAGVRGTFFVEGSAAKAHPDLLKRITGGGHAIANHSQTHTRFVSGARRHGMDWVLREVEQCSDVLFAAVGMRPSAVRPPHWSIRKDIFRELDGRGYRLQFLDNPRMRPEARVLRDVNTADYLYVQMFGNARAPSYIVRHVREAMALRERKGIYTHILVFHELPATAAALRGLLSEWAGTYEFVMLDALTRSV